MNSLELRQAIRAKYAWPGGYPMHLVCIDGGCLCMACARKEYKQIARANKNPRTDTQWEPAGVDINWEDPALYCDHCNARIESAYAEDEVQQ